MNDKTKSAGAVPKFEATEERKNFVRTMTGFGIPQENICLALGISLPTLHRRFRKEIAKGAAQVETQLVSNMLRLANGKDGTAFRANEFLLNCRFGWSRYAPPPAPPKEPELGKKETLAMEARTGHETTGWGELLN